MVNIIKQTNLMLHVLGNGKPSIFQEATDEYNETIVRLLDGFSWDNLILHYAFIVSQFVLQSFLLKD